MSGVDGMQIISQHQIRKKSLVEGPYAVQEDAIGGINDQAVSVNVGDARIECRRSGISHRHRV